MSSNKRGILNKLLTKRTDFVQLIFAALILALGISLLANYLTDYFTTKVYLLYISIFLISSVIIYLTFSVFKYTERNFDISSLLVFDKSKNEILPIPRFGISTDVVKTLDAIFLENKALKKYWEEDPLTDLIEEDEDNDSIKKEDDTKSESKKDKVEYFSVVKTEPETVTKNKSEKILKEILEYVLIEKLSTHLSTYFNGFDDPKDYIREHTRKDFPNILLENRVLNLLSTPFENRSIFIQNDFERPDVDEGEIVAIYGTDGSRFSWFELVLPKKTSVERTKNGGLKLENNRIEIKLNVKPTRFTKPTPRGFETYYLGVENHRRKLHTMEVQLSLNAKIKYRALFFKNGWDYHRWIDSFIQELIDFSSFEKFLDKISWESQLSKLIIRSNRKRIFSGSETNGTQNDA